MSGRTGEHPWIAVAWDLIQPGDVVQSPDGADWHVTGRIDMPDDPEISFMLSEEMIAGDGTVFPSSFWTDRPRGTRVQAWRFSESPAIPGAEAFAIGRLRLAGIDVTEVPGE